MCDEQELQKAKEQRQRVGELTEEMTRLWAERYTFHNEAVRQQHEIRDQQREIQRRIIECQLFNERVDGLQHEIRNQQDLIRRGQEQNARDRGDYKIERNQWIQRITAVEEERDAIALDLAELRQENMR